MNENESMQDKIILTDEDGNDVEFEIICQYNKDGETYFAMIPTDEGEQQDDVLEYVILKLATENGEDILVTVDDEDELDDVADYFDDLFSQELDYDN